MTTDITELTLLRGRTVDYPFYLVECECGEVYPSSELNGGEPLGECGDYSDCTCPHCREGEERFSECADPETAWKAQQGKIDELVEALEKAQQERDNWRTSFDNERFRADKLKAHIDDIEPVRAAAEKLVRCKGRYHSEQNYRALAALFGVKTPDLPPLDGESRTVKLPKKFKTSMYGTSLYEDLDILKMLTDAGIKWEAE